MKRHLLILLLSILSTSATIAQTQYFFYVQLNNKQNSPYSLSQPEQYLSQRAINRRATYGIACDSTDLPVNPAYIAEIAVKGVKVHNRSKWLNGISVRMADTSIVSQIRALPFVKWAKYTGQMNSAALPAPRKAKFGSEAYNYGTAATQINQLNGSALHNAGYTGKGIHIAVLDAGFNNVNTNPGFDSLRLQGRLLGTKDFAEPNSNIYALDAHGANVLSIMTGNLPGQYLGSAPHASYWLLRTEYAPSEYMMELDFWVSAIEFADSAGVDVVNSSLGYTTFDDAAMNFTYADMNGKTARASIAAEMAAKKGIVVCNSAGNDGSRTWKYIGSPADADGIFTIGANTSTGTPSSFTSFGPSYDGRVKPEISGMGSSTAIINTAGLTSTGNGTSYSSPLMCGMLACLLQYCKAEYPNISPDEFYDLVLHSSSLYNAPTNRMGYGITNFQQAMTTLAAFSRNDRTSENKLKFAYLADKNVIRIENPENDKNVIVNIFDSNGKRFFSNTVSENLFEIDSSQLPSGIYFLNINSDIKRYSGKVIIQ